MAKTKIDVDEGIWSVKFDGELVKFIIFYAMKTSTIGQVHSLCHIDVFDSLKQELRTMRAVKKWTQTGNPDYHIDGRMQRKLSSAKENVFNQRMDVAVIWDVCDDDEDDSGDLIPLGELATLSMIEPISMPLCSEDESSNKCCMMSIFSKYIEKCMEVFMDDFTVYGDSFANFLGHIVSEHGVEVDPAKIDVIAKLLYPTNLREVRSFLGHTGFYRRFIKDFSKIAQPMTSPLQKDVAFDSNDE
ncbi:uncharacterized protein LOC120084727 [Benincasa hispida]|uniref:uncharacterized protein LOC120084727 n=1 Tax=Benincasa hispida TaxID=102211 RepID=UPI001901500C|nr:uncharacterized protein LOC120084727 [Benincasa hispida]